jgi:hypothetical protein
LPYLARCPLGLLVDKLDAGTEQSGAGHCKVGDFEGDDGTVPEEMMIVVQRAIDVNFGFVAQLESA